MPEFVYSKILVRQGVIQNIFKEYQKNTVENILCSHRKPCPKIQNIFFYESPEQKKSSLFF